MRRWTVLALMLGLFAIPANAADPAFGGVETAVAGGAAYRSSSGNSWLAGGSIGGALSKHVLLVGEGSYSRLAGDTVDLGGALVQGTAVARFGHGELYEGHGGIHLQYPISETRVAPYGGFGLGVVNSSFNAEVRVTGQPIGPRELVVQQSFRNTSLAYYAPFGLRYYIKDNWGVRPEVGVFWGREFTTFYRFSVGLFYQFKRR